MIENVNQLTNFEHIVNVEKELQNWKNDESNFELRNELIENFEKIAFNHRIITEILNKAKTSTNSVSEDSKSYLESPQVNFTNKSELENFSISPVRDKKNSDYSSRKQNLAHENSSTSETLNLKKIQFRENDQENKSQLSGFYHQLTHKKRGRRPKTQLEDISNLSISSTEEKKKQEMLFRLRDKKNEDLKKESKVNKLDFTESESRLVDLVNMPIRRKLKKRKNEEEENFVIKISKEKVEEFLKKVKNQNEIQHEFMLNNFRDYENYVDYLKLRDEKISEWIVCGKNLNYTPSLETETKEIIPQIIWNPEKIEDKEVKNIWKSKNSTTLFSEDQALKILSKSDYNTETAISYFSANEFQEVN